MTSRSFVVRLNGRAFITAFAVALMSVGVVLAVKSTPGSGWRPAGVGMVTLPVGWLLARLDRSWAAEEAGESLKRKGLDETRRLLYMSRYAMGVSPRHELAGTLYQHPRSPFATDEQSRRHGVRWAICEWVRR